MGACDKVKKEGHSQSTKKLAGESVLKAKGSQKKGGKCVMLKWFLYSCREAVADFKQERVPTWGFKTVTLVAVERMALLGSRSRKQRLATKATFIDSRRNRGLALGNSRTG